MKTTSIVPDEAIAEACASLRYALLQIADLVRRVDEEQYTRAPLGPLRSSLGSHVRHTLDHVRTLTRGASSGQIDYDARERDTDIERCPAAALNHLEQLLKKLEPLASLPPETPWTLVAQVRECGTPLTMSTTPLREAVFVLSHTIHHCALIGVAAHAMGLATSPKFGLAPATLTFEARPDTCAH